MRSRIILILVACLFIAKLTHAFNITLISGGASTASSVGPFTEDCTTTIDAQWTQTGTTSGSLSEWKIDGTTCNADVAAAAHTAEIINAVDGITTSNYCSMKATSMNATGGVRIGCAFRAQGPVSAGNPGIHYDVLFANDTDRARVFSRFNDHDNTYEFAIANAGDDAVCAANSDAYVDVDDNDYLGITLSGTGANHLLSMWDFGTDVCCVNLFDNCTSCTQTTGSPDTLCDVDGVTTVGVGTGESCQVPSTWGIATYACTVGEFDSNMNDLGKINSVGRCGVIAISGSTTNSTEPNFDDFACGDFTP